jgi:hypothetical protein
MSERKKTKNDVSWDKIFEKYNIQEHISRDGKFIISANQIKEFREPRLMAKTDNYDSLPAIFKEHQLAILPISRSEYYISSIEVYKDIQSIDSEIKHVVFPGYIQSLDTSNLRSETMAVNAAKAAGIFEDFLSEEGLESTVSGRMTSGAFAFKIQSINGNFIHEVSINNSQIEIDSAIEGYDSLTLVEAKLYTAPDILVRQLYYPYRTWADKLRKKVRTIFFVFSNGIFNLYEYSFPDPSNYNSISLIKAMRYSIDDTRITIEDVELLANSINSVPEPMVPFPQADKFERVIDLCSNLYNQNKSLEEIALDYGFDIRQADYYSAAAIYLGLVEKKFDDGITQFSLTEIGKQIFDLNYKERQLSLCKKILEHKVFMAVYKISLDREPAVQDIVTIMKTNYLYNIQSDETYKRRAQTIRCWIDWIFKLVEP